MENSRTIGKLISPEELLGRYSLSQRAQETVSEGRSGINGILEGKDNRKILIVGPCSADYEDSLLEYGKFIHEMRKRFGDRIEIIMRYYTGKPRTIGGWKGIQNSKPGSDPDINTGLIESRDIAIKLLNMGVPLADEMLHPQYLKHVEDTLSYIAVGARSTENQYHREVASGTNIAVGMKNCTSGDIISMINGIQAGQTPSNYTIGNYIMQSEGNPLVHGILRGGAHGSNYDRESILRALLEMEKRNIRNPSIIVDASHDNARDASGNKYAGNQVRVIRSLIESILPSMGGKGQGVKGFMVESYLEDGNQPIGNGKHGISLTDPCIGIPSTKQLIEEIHREFTYSY